VGAVEKNEVKAAEKAAKNEAKAAEKGANRVTVKGNSFRGGSKKSRDKWYGYDDKGFQRWWHRDGKKDFGGLDLENAEEASNAFEYWKSLGRPTAK